MYVVATQGRNLCSIRFIRSACVKNTCQRERSDVICEVTKIYGVENDIEDV